MKTSGSLFSGGGLADWGYREAGFTPVVAVEKEAALAEVYRTNFGPHITVADVREVDFRRLERPDLLHMSPVCTRASQANSGATECDLDITCAEACARAVEVWMPEAVILENVWGYRSFRSFKLICAALDRLGYWYQVHHLNSADFLVPQTRKRLFLRASRDGWLPPLPTPTRWVGWYEAIEDIVHTLPESEFAPWQLERLPDLFKTCLVERHGARNGPLVVRDREEPAWTMRASERNAEVANAFLVDGDNAGKEGPIYLNAEMPSRSISRSSSPRAFLVSSMDCTVRDAAEPAVTMLARGDKSIPPRAFLVGDQKRQYADSGAPSFTVRAGENGGTTPRAFIVDGQQTNPGKTPGDRATRTLITRDEDEPIWTVPASVYEGEPRAWLQHGRVVKMTPRALARFMGLPDTYQLPDHTGTACTVLGNGVCPPITKALSEQFI